MFNRNTQCFAFSAIKEFITITKNTGFCHKDGAYTAKLICPNKQNQVKTSEVNTNKCWQKLDMQDTLQCNELVKKKKNQPAYANPMFLGQTKFPYRAQRNSVAHGVSFPPRTIGMAEQNYHAFKFFYTSITSNTYFTWLTWNVLEETIFLTIAKLYNVYIFSQFLWVGFPPGSFC